MFFLITDKDHRINFNLISGDSTTFKYLGKKQTIECYCKPEDYERMSKDLKRYGIAVGN